MKDTVLRDKVILVDQEDHETGVMDKLQAHHQGVLHRAFSVFVFTTSGDVLLQKRAVGKYHSSGLWSNACCSHPQPGETTEQAASKRLQEEMGISCALKQIGFFIYKADVGDGLTEYELDHVLVGITDSEPAPELSEVQDWKYMNPLTLELELNKNPRKFTAWFGEAWQQVLKNIQADTTSTP